MRVLVVTQYFWPETFRINDLVADLKDRGHEVSVFTGKPNYPTGRYFSGYGFFSRWADVFHDVPVHRAPLIPRGDGTRWRLALNYLSFAFFASILGPFQCRGSYELIFVYEPSPITVCLPAIVLKWVKRAPLILWVGDPWPESLSATGAVRSTLILQAVEKLVRFIYHRCDRILVQSQAFIPSILSRGIESRKVDYFPNWAESLYRVVSPGTELKGEEKLPEGFRIMFAGNIGGAQAFETIVAAAKVLSPYADIHWVVLGEGHRKKWVEEEIKRLGLEDRFHLLGRHPVETMPHYFALADAMLVTLKRDPIFSMTVPSKVQSYFACAKPVIASAGGELGRMLTVSGAGVSCPAEDHVALAETVLRVYRMSPEERREMGEKGRRYYEKHFRREHLIDRLERWMRETAQGQPCGS